MGSTVDLSSGRRERLEDKWMIAKQANQVELRSECPVCGENAANCSPESPNYYACPSCQVVFRKTLTRRRPEEWDSAYFSDQRILKYYGQRYSAFEKIVGIVDSLVPARGRWLDVGCGPGLLLDAAALHGWQVHGLEPSRSCIEAARKRMECICITEGAIETTPAAFKDFDVVSLCRVVSFLAHPGEALRQVRDALSAGGWIVIRESKAAAARDTRQSEAPALDSHFVAHLQEWSPPAMENALRLAGFRNVRTMPSPAFTETGALERGGDHGLAKSITRLAKHLAWPVSRVTHTLSAGSICLGPNFLAFGQK